MLPAVNKKLLPMKGHYMFFNAATAPVIPFLPVMARQLGFSGTIVGLIYTILPIVGMIAKPVLGGIADKYSCKKLLFILFQVITAVSLFGINYVPQITTQGRVHFACDAGESVFDFEDKKIEDKCAMGRFTDSIHDLDVIQCELKCAELTDTEYNTMCTNWDNDLDHCKDRKKDFSFTALVPRDKIEVFNSIIVFKVVNISLHEGALVEPLCPNETTRVSTFCSAECDSAAVNELISTPLVQGYDVVRGFQFWEFTLLAVLGWVGMAVVVSIGDAICFEMLGDKPNLYGLQRLWGSVGWGLFSIPAGLMVDYFSEGRSVKDYTSAFYLMIALIAVDVIISCRLQYKQEFMSANIFKDVAKVLTRARIFVYLIWCVFVGTCTGLVWNFQFWLVEDVAKANDHESGECGGHHEWIKTLEGLVMGVQCLGGELPFFFLSSWILGRVGHVHCMSIVLLGIGVRFMLYSVLTNPWWILPVELTHGVTFGLFYATMASYASIVAPPGTEATVQGLVGAVFEGIGVSLGSLVGGILYDAYGGWTTFKVFGIASLFCCGVHVLVQYFLAKKETDVNAVSTQYVPPKEAVRILDNDAHEFTLVAH